MRRNLLQDAVDPLWQPPQSSNPIWRKSIIFVLWICKATQTDLLHWGSRRLHDLSESVRRPLVEHNDYNQRYRDLYHRDRETHTNLKGQILTNPGPEVVPGSIVYCEVEYHPSPGPLRVASSSREDLPISEPSNATLKKKLLNPSHLTSDPRASSSSITTVGRSSACGLLLIRNGGQSRTSTEP